MRIAAIVVAYNMIPEKLIQRILTYSSYVNEVVIVDNSTENFHIKDLCSKHEYKYISMNGNYGIAAALNKGIEYCVDKNYDYVLTMDQDSEFINNPIRYYQQKYDENIIIYCPNYIISRRANKKHNKKFKYVDWTMASGNLLNLNLFKKNGLFREDFFIDGVDYEYCLRAKKNGFKILK